MAQGGLADRRLHVPPGRQRKDNGNPTLYAQIARQFDVPAAEGSNGQNQAALFQHWIYLTQVRPHRHTRHLSLHASQPWNPACYCSGAS